MTKQLDFPFKSSENTLDFIDKNQETKNMEQEINPENKTYNRVEIFEILSNKTQIKKYAIEYLYQYLVIYCYENNIDINLQKNEMFVIKFSDSIKTILEQLTTEQLINFLTDLTQHNFHIFNSVCNDAKS